MHPREVYCVTKTINQKTFFFFVFTKGGCSLLHRKKSTGTLSKTSDDLKISHIFALQTIHTEIKLVE